MTINMYEHVCERSMKIVEIQCSFIIICSISKLITKRETSSLLL